MANLIISQFKLTNLIRWAARILSLVSVGMVMLFIIGEGFDIARVKLSEWLLFLFFPFGISIGMILAWWQEGIGGTITVGSLVMFYVVHFAIAGMFPHGWAFLVFTIPGFLFLLYWHRTRKVHNIA